ncbi:MAG TPA: hypothetical protein VLO11_15395 [Luteolibacter sp.]|nr:hypothetical protein [Luteolibacter sp.]
MNRQPHHTDESCENDTVWKLLDASPPATASPRFASETVRMARLAGVPEPWWKRLLAPAPLAGLVAASAAVAIAITGLLPDEPSSPDTAAAEPAAFSEIQEIAEAEILLSAVDHLDQFSDGELVSLIGF